MAVNKAIFAATVVPVGLGMAELFHIVNGLLHLGPKEVELEHNTSAHHHQGFKIEVIECGKERKKCINYKVESTICPLMGKVPVFHWQKSTPSLQNAIFRAAISC